MEEQPCYLDRRAYELIEKLRADPRPEFSTSELAVLLGVSASWIKSKRLYGGGPGFIRTDPPLLWRVFYPRAAVAAWLESRREMWERTAMSRRRAA